MLVDRLVGWRLSLLLFAAVAAAFALPLSRQLRLDRSIENLFAPDDPLMQPYRLLQEQFGAHDVVLAVYVDRLLLDERGIGILQQMEVRKRLEAVPGVRETLRGDVPGCIRRAD